MRLSKREALLVLGLASQGRDHDVADGARRSIERLKRRLERYLTDEEADELEATDDERLTKKVNHVLGSTLETLPRLAVDSGAWLEFELVTLPPGSCGPTALSLITVPTMKEIVQVLTVKRTAHSLHLCTLRGKDAPSWGSYHVQRFSPAWRMMLPLNRELEVVV